MTRTFPDWFAALGVRSVDFYAGRMLDNLVGLSPRRGTPGSGGGPTVVVLTPGIYNSAYFEHAFLAQQMGVELSRAATCSCSTTASTCARPMGAARST